MSQSDGIRFLVLFTFFSISQQNMGITVFCGCINRILQEDVLTFTLICDIITFVYMQGYRSGHNEAVLKTVCRQARGFESHTLRHFGVECMFQPHFSF